MHGATESFYEAVTPKDTERRAFVMMAYDPPTDLPGQSLWGVLAMARALQRLSKYPMVLLSNTTKLPDGTDVAERLSRLNVIMVPVHEVEEPRQKAWTFQRWNIAFWKMQVWLLTDYDKVVWLDSDSIAYRSLDWIFDLEGTWAQRDDWFCRLKQPSVCSGLLSLKPSKETFQGLLDYASTSGERLDRGDQQLIEKYFREVVKEPIQLLDDVDAAFGQCVGTAATPDFTTPQPGSWWSVPAFVHKSGGWGDTNDNVYSNVCFSSNMTRQRYVIGGSVINVCHFHPLAAYWRLHFCEGAAVIGTSMPEVKTFCSDSCYYNGTNPDGTSCEKSKDWQISAVLEGTPSQRYPARLIPALAPIGEPVPELLEAPVTTTTIAPRTGLVRYHSFNMKTWNCGGKCPRGGCCAERDCAYQCHHSKAFKGACHGFKWNPSIWTCELLSEVEAAYSSEGGHSGKVFADTLFFNDARLPQAPFTLTATIRTSSQGDCLNILAWGDGEGSWMSAEFRVTLGDLLYGENPLPEPTTPGEVTWREVRSKGLRLADGAWHNVAVVREASGQVSLYANGQPVAVGHVAKEMPPKLMAMARTARISHSIDCVFDGDVTHVRIYDSALSAAMLRTAG